MDVLDAELLAGLTESCRRPMRELAGRLGISVAAVHKRMLRLEESGLIQSYVTLTHPGLFGAKVLSIQGQCKLRVNAERCEALGADPGVFEITVNDASAVDIMFLHRTPEELSRGLAAAREILGLEDPKIYEIDMGPVPEVELSQLDCALAMALRHRARETVAQLARRLDATEREIRQGLERLTSRGALLMFPAVAPMVSGDHWADIIVEKQEGLQIRDVVDELRSDPDCRVLWVTQYVDPTRALLSVWSPTREALRRFDETLCAQPGIERCAPVLFLLQYEYPVWIDDALTAGAEQGPAALRAWGARVEDSKRPG